MLEKCIDSIVDHARGRVVSRALIGSGFIVVQLDDSSVGLCANIHHDPDGSCSVYQKAGTLAGSKATDLLALSTEPDPISRGLALATVNAIAPALGRPPVGDLFDHVAVDPGDRVVMVGFIAPVAAMLKAKGCDVSVFEDRKRRHPLMVPRHEMPFRVRSADIVILTGTTIVNGTITDILSLPKKARTVIIMGPSTPMIPSVFAGTGVSYLAGSSVVDPDRAFSMVMEGGGTRHLQKCGAISKAYMEVE